MTIKSYLFIMGAIAYTVVESLWAGWLLKSELHHAGYEISLIWAYFGFYLLLNSLDFFTAIDNLIKIAFRVNNAGWIIIATLLLWGRGII